MNNISQHLNIQHLTFDSHVGNICKVAYIHIRGLRHVRSAMSRETANTVACAIVGSRLDYCNSLLAGMSSKNLDKLQRVQNTLARLVTGTQRREHITPVLAELHWLPVRARITFQISTIVFKLRQNRQPSYLAELIRSMIPLEDFARPHNHYSSNLTIVSKLVSDPFATSLPTPGTIYLTH